MKTYQTSCFMPLENFLQPLHHGIEIGMSRLWRVRRRKQASFQRLKVKFLDIWKTSDPWSSWSEEDVDPFRCGFMSDHGIVSAVLDEEFLVIAKKRRCVNLSFIPDQHR